MEYLAKCQIISRAPEGKWVVKKMPTPLAASEEVPKDEAAGKTRVLVVDDMPMTQFVVTTLLNKFHFTCDTVNNGAEAIQATEKTKYDLILMVNLLYDFSVTYDFYRTSIWIK